MTCVQCQRVCKHLLPVTVGGPPEVCKTCLAHVQLEQQCRPVEECQPCEPFVGRVTFAGGGVQGVRVTARESDAYVVTDATGLFSLTGVVRDHLGQATMELFQKLRAYDPNSGCENWLRQAMAAGDLPSEYAAFLDNLLRHSVIGVAIDCDTFVSLLTRQDARDQIAARIFATMGKSSDIVLSFQKDGFAPLSMPLGLAALRGSGLEVALQPVSASGRIDPMAGGRIEDPNGAWVELVPGTQLVNADGALHTAAVTVSFAVIDASDAKSLSAMPGDFSAVDIVGAPAQLESFGAVWVGLFADDGASLQVAQGTQGLSMAFPSAAPVNYERLGVPPSLWEFDNVTGKWVQDADAQLGVDGIPLPRPGQDPSTLQLTDAANAKPRARGKAKGKKGAIGDEFHALDHFDFLEGATTWTPAAYAKFFGQPVKQRSFTLTAIKRAGYWNCDAPYITSFLHGSVVDRSGQPVQRANVWTVGVNYAGASPRSGMSAHGSFDVMAQCVAEVEIYVLLPGTTEACQVDVLAKPIKLRFGPFKTGGPAATQDLGLLKLADGKTCD